MIDRSDAVNLSRNVLDGEYTPTAKGIQCLARAVLQMDAYILGSTKPEERPTRDAAFMAWMRQHAPTQLAELITRRESMRSGNDHSQAITEPQSEQP